MNKEKAKRRIEKLRNLINHHRYLYHALNKEEISSEALDSLKKELFDLEQEYPGLITPDSPTQRVAGEVLEGFEKFEHSTSMLSLQDAFSKEDMIEWQDRIKKLLTAKEQNDLDYFVEPKIDGLAVALVYKRGVFQKGGTRGDGKTGEDVTNNLKTIESIPLRLNEDINCEVRGEVFIKTKDFQKLNEQRVKAGEAEYANPRNTAAGSIRQLDSKVAASRKLNFLAWQLLDEKNQAEEYEKLKKIGLIPVEGKYCRNLDEVFGVYQTIESQREKMPFEIDGVVVSVNDNALFKKLGVAGKAPKGAIAFKFALKQAKTIIEDIKVQVGRTGALTPVAHLSPVNIAGATITRATLHNMDEIKRLGVKIGDSVIVGRAGDVIPKVIKVLKELRQGDEKDFKMPKQCPVCGGAIEKRRGEVLWYCKNKNCSIRQQRQIMHFVSKAGFDIEGLGPKIIIQLWDEGLVADAADIFALQEGDLVGLERFAEKSARNLIEGIQAKKKISLPRLIYALGIDNVGEETAYDLAESISRSDDKLSIKQFSKVVSKKSPEDWQAIKDIGPIVAESIYNWFHNKTNINLLEKLAKEGLEIENYQAKRINNKLSGKTFVLTGSLSTMERELAKQKIRELGGAAVESVSAKTDFVVAGDNPGSKYEKAKKLGVKIINEQEFLTMIK